MESGAVLEMELVCCSYLKGSVRCGNPKAAPPIQASKKSQGKHTTGAQGFNNLHCLPCGTDYLTLLTIDVSCT